MMKKSMLWAVALVLTVGAGVHADMKCAMEKGDCDAAKAKMIDSRVKELTKELGLDADQQAKIKASLEKKWGRNAPSRMNCPKKLRGLKNPRAKKFGRHSRLNNKRNWMR
jgi:hypothetical protein